MRVALIAEWLDAWRGGAETSTLQFMYRLMEQGIAVEVFTRSRPSPAPGLRVHTIGGAAMSRTRRSVTFAHRVERLLRDNSFDITHAISPCRGTDIYQPRGGTVAETVDRNLALIRRPSARRVKRYANRLNFKQRYLLAMERELLRDSHGPRIVAISDYVADQLRRHYGLDGQRVFKVLNGVEPDPAPAPRRRHDRDSIRREFGLSPETVLVLLVAHNFRLKGVEPWLEALALLVRRSAGRVRSLVIGKGDSPRWHRLVARLGLADCVTFTGPSERVRAFYHAGDVLVHPTYYDPCSRVVLEAMTSGLPCITTRWDGASEMIRDGDNGFVLEEPGDAVALADRVERLLNPDVRCRMGRDAAAVGDRVSMARHTAEVIAVYERVKAARRARAG